MNRSRTVNRVWRWFTYFKRGWGGSVSFIMSVSTNIVTVYALSLSNVPWLKGIFPDIVSYAVVFSVSLVAATMAVGFLDYKKGPYKTECDVGMMNAPWYRDLATGIIRLAEGKNQEAIDILKRWEIEKKKTVEEMKV